MSHLEPSFEVFALESSWIKTLFGPAGLNIKYNFTPLTAADGLSIKYNSHPTHCWRYFSLSKMIALRLHR